MADGDAGAPETAMGRRELSEREIKLIYELLDRTEKSYGRFKFELIAYNIACLVALLLTIYSAVKTAAGSANPAALGVYLTSGGLFTVAGARITKFLSDDLKMIRDIISTILNGARP